MKMAEKALVVRRQAANVFLTHLTRLRPSGFRFMPETATSLYSSFWYLFRWHRALGEMLGVLGCQFQSCPRIFKPTKFLVAAGSWSAMVCWPEMTELGGLCRRGGPRCRPHSQPVPACAAPLPKAGVGRRPRLAARNPRVVVSKLVADAPELKPPA